MKSGKNFLALAILGLSVASCTNLAENVTSVRFLDSTQVMYFHRQRTLEYQSEPHSVLPKQLEWTSSNEEVATVDSKGVVHTFQTPGRAIIRAQVPGGAYDECMVKVDYAYLGGIQPTAVPLEVGQSVQLKAFYYAGPERMDYPYELSWSTTKPECVSVSSTGVVTALQDGIALVTAANQINEVICPVRVSSASEDGMPVSDSH